MTTADAPDDLDAPDEARPDAAESAPIDVEGGSGGGLLGRHGVSTWDAMVIATGVLLVVAFFPPAFFESWSPRLAIMLAAGPVGLVLLGRLCACRDRAALLASAALVWTVATALIGPSPRSALVGFVGRDLSALTVVAAVAFWSLGQVVSDRGRRVLVEAVIWAAASSGLVGIAQALFGVDSGPLAMFAGRPTGFATNPVFFGAVSAVGLAAGTALTARRPAARLTVALVVLGVATSMSGSRAAMIGAALALVGIAVSSRTRSASIAAAIGAASIAIGVLVDRGFGAGRNAADRLVEAGAGTDGRSDVWRYGFEAWTDRPILGYGFGRFRPAVQGRFTREFVRDYAPDDVTQAWFDAHNVGIGVLVAVGVVGLVLFAAWIALGLRMRHAWVAWALVPLVVHWGLQPVSLHTLPLAMLLFGVARGQPSAPSDVERLVRASPWIGGAVAVGLVLGGTLITVDVAFQRAADDLDVEQLETLAGVFGDDPIVADVIAQAHSVTSSSPTPGADELDWRARAAATEPDRPYWWTLLAEKQFQAGDIAAAEVSIARALALQPNNRRAVRVEILLALSGRDEERLAGALVVACDLGASDCTLEAARLIAQADEAEAGP